MELCVVVFGGVANVVVLVIAVTVVDVELAVILAVVAAVEVKLEVIVVVVAGGSSAQLLQTYTKAFLTPDAVAVPMTSTLRENAIGLPPCTEPGFF